MGGAAMRNRAGARRAARALAGAALALLLAAAPRAGGAQAVGDTPILGIEAGMHTTRIVRADSDAAGRYLITASEDRTARIWDAATGELVQILRVPIGVDNDGWVFAVALSPDGREAAVGGWMQYGGDSYGMFVFDVASGRMLRHLTGFGNVVNDLEYSPDGRHLAVIVGAGAASQILDTATWETVATLGTNHGTSYNAAWSPDGRLATVNYDGHVRLYDSSFRMIRSRRPIAGGRAFDIAFSPDGRMLALGFENSHRVLLLDAQTLATIGEPDTTGVSEGADMGKPAWSPDGRRLYAGGSDSFEAEGWWPRYIRVWEEGGLGTYHDVGVAGNTILDLETLPDGRLAIVSGQPDIAMLDPSLRYLWQHPSPSNDYADRDRSHLRVNADGSVVGARPFGRAPFTFDIAARELRAAESTDPPYSDHARAMAFTDWIDSPEPRLNGRVLRFLEDYEWSRSAAVAADGSFGVIGGDWNVYGVNPDGSMRWRARAPGSTWAINLARNGRVAVAAHGDGTLRWYRSSDGALLLSLFILAGTDRWVAWTPSGYYDASPGGEELIGWHVNRGLETEPVWFSAAVFRDRFYRPDVVQTVLSTLDEGEALREANGRRQLAPGPAAPLGQELPPVLRIDSPARGELAAGDRLTLLLGVSTAADAPITDLRVLINGRPQPAPEVTPSAEGLSVSLDLSGQSEEELWITVMAANRHGYGPPADVTVMRPAAGRPFTPFEAKPKLYVLAVGTSVYRDPALTLRYAAKDATDFANLVLAQEGGLYRSVELRLLTDEQATYENIREGLFWLEEQVTANDSAYIFIAGHGVNDNRGELFYLPHEADVANLRRTALPAREIVSTIEYLPGRVVYFMDACHSGNLEVTRRAAVALDVNGHLQDLRAATGAVVFSSATGSQYSLESPEWGNGAFTRALREGIVGVADYNGDGAVSVEEMNLYISQRVKELTANRQTPVVRKPPEVADFPLALARGEPPAP